jgi:5-carboxymethyl-2-hydroxymuconate isomerase
MPHLIVEFSSNVEQALDIRVLLSAIHRAAAETGVFDSDTIRTRAERRDLFVIADGAARNAFVAVDLRMGPGQSEETRQRIGRAIFSALETATASARRNLSIRLSLEVREASSVRFREGMHTDTSH